MKKTADPNDVLILGTPDFRYEGGYKPTMIKVKDFGGGGPSGPVCDITMEQKNVYPTIELGPTVSFTKTDYGSEVDVIIPGVLEITRDDQQGIYNSALESSFAFPSPANTEWASANTDGNFSYLSTTQNYETLVYDVWVNARDWAFDPNYGIVGVEMIMHEVTTDRYFYVKFNQWTPGGAGGGFSYERTEVILIPPTDEPCKFTYSDGTIQTTAFDPCNIVMPSQPITLGPAVTVTVDLFTQIPPVDVLIPGQLEVQFDQFGLYFTNVASINGPNNLGWNSVYCGSPYGYADLNDIETRPYCFWYIYNETNFETVLYDADTKTYWKFYFQDFNWKTNFSYTREQIFLPELCKITFSDGSKIDSAKGLVTGPNVTENINDDGTVTYNVAGSDVLYSNVAFVDPVAGNNFTAQIGKFNLPYSSISQAYSAATGTVTSTNPALVYIRKGYYSSINIAIQNDVDIYCEEGVQFGSGQFQDLSSTGKRFRLLGHARFKYTFTQTQWLFRFTTDAKVELNFDYADNVPGFLYIGSSCEATVRCNWIRCHGYNGGGYGASLRDTSKAWLYIKDYYQCQHACIYPQGTGAKSLYVECPRLEIIPNYTSNYGQLNKQCVILNQVNTFPIHIKGNLYNSDPSVNCFSCTQASSLIVVNNSTNSTAYPIITVEGNLYGGASACVHPNFLARYGRIIIRNGVITSVSMPPVHTWTTGSTSPHTGSFTCEFIDCKVIGPNANVCGRSRVLYFQNTNFYNSADPTAFPSAACVSIQSNFDPGVAKMFFINCNGEMGGATSTFVQDVSAINPAYVEIGMVNTYSNKQIGTGVTDTWGGYTEIPTFSIPKTIEL